ncbi:MAG: D-glycerate dehydrogenase [Caldilineales bacterium]|nr:D-glycerate dehydrogenase [Caldilineales bacterium]
MVNATPALPRVFVTRRLPEPAMSRLYEAPLVLDLWPEAEPPPYDNLRRRVAGCQGLLCLLTDRIDEGVLDAAGPALRVVSQMAVGVDNIDLAACTRRGIPVGHTPGVLTEATADLAVALMLATARRLVEAANDVKAGRWRTWDPMGWVGPDLHGSTVGIVGLGRIGAAVARRLRGFAVRLLYHNPRPSPFADEVGATWVPWETLLAASDFLTLHCPYSPATHHLINAAALAQMKPTAILINTARGGVVDQEALLQALRAGQIAAAGLDVTTPEPLPPDHPLLSLPNVVVLPHIGSASLSARRRMAEMAVDNLLAGLAGERLPHCANPEVYEKK